MTGVFDRPNMEKYLTTQMAQVLTKEKHSRMQAYVKGLSDYDFYMLMEEAKKFAPGFCSVKDYANMAKKLILESDEKSDDTGLSNLNIEFLHEDVNEALLRKIDASRPSDIIRLSGESDKRLINLWEGGIKEQIKKSGVFIPSDLFFAKTVPLMDCTIVVDERDCVENATTTTYRVVIFGDYAEELHAATENDIVKVGCIILDNGSTSLFFPINVVRGVDGVMFGDVGYRNITAEYRAEIEKVTSVQSTMQMAISFLETWYGIQIALLHPIVHDVFRHPKTTVDSGGRVKKQGQRKNKVRYVKEHIIASAELDTAVYGEDKTFTRHALVWYVIGHWRVYADGRKVFVKPYWKGTLRDLKLGDSDREREIAQLYDAAVICEEECAHA